jgi:DNA-binding protein YbaB
VFDKLKALGAVASLMKDKDRLRETGERVKARATAIRAEGQGGQGAVRVIASGQLRVVSIELAPALAAGMAADARSRQLAGALIAEAVNEALAGAQRQVHDELRREAEALGLGGLPGELGGLLS